MMDTSNIKRVQAKVSGRVQGVGFRPTVYLYATELGLSGWVENSTQGVLLEIEGTEEKIEIFIKKLKDSPPPLALVKEITVTVIPSIGTPDFVIRESSPQGESVTLIPIDTSLCNQCKGEMDNPADRRYHYPFTNCTHCGPRYTLIEDLPYDRPLTTMKHFPMCPQCHEEYTHPANRRFHAQPISCPYCGPQLKLVGPEGEITTDSPLRNTIELLKNGAILGIKGIGGYHIACDATCTEAVNKLRQRKHRPDKPFAIMMPDMETIRGLCQVTPLEESLLTSAQAPIVLLERKAEQLLAAGVAPDNDRLGVMLPYTPLHWLLMKDFIALVMTSANLSEEPLISQEEELTEMLGTVLDAALIHDRPIAHKCDDSIVKVITGKPVMIRRARGYVPDPFTLPYHGPKIFAAGAELKAAFALTRDDSIYLSQHLGDLQNYKTLENYQYEYQSLTRLLEIEPEVVVHDLHPDYGSSRFARQLPISEKIAVQHHHAHLAACMLENKLTEPVIGLCFDGTGYGTDGHIWGSEFLMGDFRSFTRLAHFEYQPMPGGDKAAEEPWRMALSYLYSAYQEEWQESNLKWLDEFPSTDLTLIKQMLALKINTPLTCGLGRLFDAIYGILGHTERRCHEGRGGMVLESIANPMIEESYTLDILPEGEGWTLSPLPMIREICQEIKSSRPPSTLSGKFHQTLAVSSSQVCELIREKTGLHQVVLTGGCFQNSLLTFKVKSILQTMGFDVYTHSQIPPNDGGISFGQAGVALGRLYK